MRPSTLVALSAAALIALRPVASSADEQLLDAESSVARVFELADARLALMPAIAAWKWQQHAPVTDSAREQAVVTRAVSLGAPLGLPSSSVQQLFNVQVVAAREVQGALHEKWRAEGFHFDARVPSLEKELRPQLDRLSIDLLRALYIAAPALASADFANRLAPGAARLLKARGWTPANRAELIAALASVRLTSSASLARVRAAGVLRIGTTGDYAPFSLESDGRLSGMDVELARALAHELAVEPIFLRTSWPSLNEDLRRDAFDLAIGGISATAERRAAAALSVPYLSGGKTIIARCADAARFAGIAAVDRAGVRVIVNPGGTNEQFVRANLHRAAIRVYADNRTIFDEIRARRADVMITDDTEVELQVHRHPELCRALSGTLTHANKVILSAPDPALLAAVNDWLSRALSAGTPARLLEDSLSH